MPAHLFVELGAQAQGTGYRGGRLRAVGYGVPVDKVGPDQHQFTGAEARTVGQRLGYGLAVEAVGISKAPQLLRDGHQFGGHGQVVETRYTEDARFDSELGLSS
ncbi:hypothetical protein D3C80_2000200 [compost metagenome]